MFSLYWKVFLGFWLTSLVLGGSAVFISLELRSIDPLELRGLTPLNLMRQSSFVVHQLPGELDAWQAQLGEHDIQLYVSWPDKTALTKPVFPDSINRILQQLDQKPHLENASLTRFRIGRNETGSNGKQVKFVLDMPSTMVFRLKELVSQLSVQFALALSLSGLVCYLLARYLTRNLKRLSEASQALANGDLSARVMLTSNNRKDELTQLANDFNYMAGELGRGIENQRRLVRDISHELRSPLTRMQIALELARQKGGSEELDRIEQEADRLNELIGQILSMPDESGELPDIIDLRLLLESIIDDSRIEADVKKVQLLMSSQVDEALVEANAEQLHSALENIIRNAIHYTRDNSEVSIKLKANTEAYEVEVNDCGPGVPDDDIVHIFEPFYRVDRARNRGTGGYGIGLAIVERTIAQHKGSVRAENSSTGLSIIAQIPKPTNL